MARPNIASVSGSASTPPTTNAEVVAITTNGLTTSGPGATVHILAAGVFTPGTSTTALVCRVRRGTTVSGTLVGAAVTIPASATVAMVWQVEVDDALGDAAGQQYVVTMQQTNGAATGTGGPYYVLTIAE